MALAAPLLLTSGLLAGGKVVPALLGHAKYVVLGYDTGDRFVAVTDAIGREDLILPSDQAALSDLSDRIEQWGQYTIVTRPEQAELFITVRTGRRVTLGASTHLGTPASGSSATQSPAYSAEISSQGDMVSIYEARTGGGTGTLLWREKQSTGLPGFPAKIFEQLKSDVERIPKKP
jgi:hypothetical protein